ncbi:DGAT1/2-independent enzyme synthesizing storage lipids [Dermacentor andersoni]|uniref:DGAT1/2-independent enzyme synthesizing storage lipids n=1 Tax=Dermacentor andersoni TaxID=34620 RepID=UPI0021552C8E|nr:transmembrane protein 68-like [Dermacentor andersoni]XP_050030672.1 transmembrane protein 68-like [Dermacentor andersoni]
MEVPSLLHWVSDLDYFNWLVWLFTPVAVAFLLPTLVILLLYISILFLHIYRYRRPLRDAYARHFWDGARYTLALLWSGHGRVWHGYEVQGIENIPDTGGALLVYYHGALPLDYYYLVASCLLHKRRLIRGVGDRFLFMVPGFKILTEVFKVSPGTVQSCAQVMRDGNLLAIAPGGVLEAQFGDERYRLLWKKRLGFAKAAIEARVPIVPVFTENIREAFRAVAFGRGLFKRLYDRTRLPIVPIYGGFPVKLRTIVGPPIPFDPNMSPQELAHKAASAVEDLIQQHQEIPGSIVRALAQRFNRT